MPGPFIAIDSYGEVDVLKDAESVSTWLEAQDVRDGEYRLFDCEGLEYELTAESDDAAVLVGPPTSADRPPEFFKSVITQFVSSRAGKAPAAGTIDDPDNLCGVLQRFAR